MTHRDLPAVIAIERAAYEFPWSEGILRDCVRVGYSCWVYDLERDIQAYGVMSIAAGECHLLNLCVRPQSQGQGIGRALLRNLIGTARRRSVDTVVLEVRVSNQPAIRLYQSEGFNTLGMRNAYYPSHGGREDAMLMAKAL